MKNNICNLQEKTGRNHRKKKNLPMQKIIQNQIR